MNKLFFTFLLSAFALGAAMLPQSFALAQGAPLDYSGFVKCDGVVNENEPERSRKCDFEALMLTVKSALNWMFYISIPVVTVLFAYAGLLYLTGGPGKKGEAKKIFTTIGIGFIIMLVAWLGVRVFVDWFVKSNSAATLFLEK